MNHNLIYCPEDFIKDMEHVFFKKGQTVIKKNTYPHYVYIVIEGIANTFYINCQCRDIVASYFLKGDFIGEINAVCRQKYMFDAIAQSDMELVKIPANIFIQRMKTDFRLVESMIQSQNNRINYLEGFALSNASLPIYEKILLFLCCFHSEDQYRKIFSKDFLCAYLGVNIRSINRILKTMSQKGFIRTGNGKIIIADYKKLYEEAKLYGVEGQIDFFCRNIVDGYPEELEKNTDFTTAN